MTAFTRSLISASLLVVLASGTAWAASKTPQKPEPPAPTGPPNASFYELTETMQLLTSGGTKFRVATSALAGSAALGTPFCPTALAQSVMADPKFCTLVAIGKDNVSLTTGIGHFNATLDIVVQGDNPVDGPEFLVAEIKVTGRMDFSPAILSGLPYGTVAGALAGKSLPTPRPQFIGVFRLPFLGGGGVRSLLCPLTLDPNPNFPPDKDYVYVDTTSTGWLTGKCIDILPDELALGVPTVRFDIWFK